MSINPLVWLHFRLAGSWRQNAPTVAVYVALVVVGATVSYRMSSPTTASGAVSSVWLGIVTAAQGAFLLLIAPGAIRRSILRDFQSGMIESHRLSPMSGIRIIIGYLTGPPVQAFCLVGAGLLLGTYFAVDAARGLSPMVVAGWYVFQLCLLCVAFMVAAAAVLVALGTAGKLDVLSVLILAMVVGGWAALPFIPGLALATGVLGAGDLVRSLFQGGPTGVAADTGSIALAAAVQLALALVFVRAACRKIRAPEQAMFSMPLGLLLAAVWAAILVLGMALLPAQHWLLRDLENATAIQIIASAATFMLVALFPLAAAANECFRLNRTAAFGVPVPRVRLVDTVLVPLLLGALGLVTIVLMYRWTPEGRIPYAVSADAFKAAFAHWRPLVAMLAAFVLTFWIDFGLVFWITARGLRMFRAIVLATLLLKAVPLLAALAAVTASEALDQPCAFVEVHFAGLSPIGTLILCMFAGGNPWPGLIGQLVLAIGVTALVWHTRRSLLRGAAPLGQPQGRETCL